MRQSIFGFVLQCEVSNQSLTHARQVLYSLSYICTQDKSILDNCKFQFTQKVFFYLNIFEIEVYSLLKYLFLGLRVQLRGRAYAYVCEALGSIPNIKKKNFISCVKSKEKSRKQNIYTSDGIQQLSELPPSVDISLLLMFIWL